MKELVLYIHGKGGCAGESEHYKPLFPECEVVGLDCFLSAKWSAWIIRPLHRGKPGRKSGRRSQR